MLQEGTQNKYGVKNHYLLAVPCVCVLLSWLGCHYCGRNWKQRERLPSSAVTTCSDEWHTVWLLLPWNGNEHVQVRTVVVTLNQEQSHMGNEYVQIRIIIISGWGLG
jgi:hypothetical protein